MTINKVHVIPIRDNSKFDEIVNDIISNTPVFKLSSEWCSVGNGGDECQFHSYPGDGQCSCGVYKHHVHCWHGGIIQVG